jgi:hypothetical protein
MPLERDLLPVLRSFIGSILPGLEEETSENFSEIVHMLDVLCEKIGVADFYRAVWLCNLAHRQTRVCCLNYVSRRVPKLQDRQMMIHVFGEDIDLMIRSLNAALQDDQILVKRGALELICTHLPLESR